MKTAFNLLCTLIFGAAFVYFIAPFAWWCFTASRSHKLAIGLGTGAVLLVCYVVFNFPVRTRKERR